MMQGDIFGLLCVYIYVLFLLIFTEKILKKYPTFNRKILHILTGNIAFILPFFLTREIMVFLAAAPFIVFTFMISPYSPIKKIRSKTSKAGHGMGLVYYAISWTVLAYFFFDYKVVIAIGILSMSYGDGLAALFGISFGKKKYNILGDEKSVIGSLSMFVFTFILIIIALFYYGLDIDLNLVLSSVFLAFIATIVEGITPWGLDNLSVSFVVSFLFWGLFIL